MDRVVGGRYRLVESLGAGGMGQVWRAEDQVLQRQVAVKVVTLAASLDESARQELRTRVLREARAAARIDHPATVRVFDVRDEGEAIQVVMELVAAPTLEAVVGTEGPLDAQRAAEVGLGLVGALEAAHQAGIVHRDVKPANVMMLDGGGVKLADFGIAAAKDDTRITSAGLVLGTPSYMSPEQARGEAVTAAVDLWGLGALLYFAVHGASPFARGEALPTLNAVLHDPPRPPPRGALAPTIEALLTKVPEDRPTLAETRRSLAQVARSLGGASGAEATAVLAPPTPRDPLPPSPPQGSPPWTPEPGAGAPPPPDRRPREGPRPAAGLAGDGRAWLVGIGLAAVAVLVAVLVAANLGGGGNGTGAGTGTAVEPGAAPTTASPSGASTDPAPTTVPPDTTAAASPPETEGEAPRGVPRDWVRLASQEGSYTIWHPPAWEPRPGPAASTDIVDPGSGDYLRIDSVAEPGADPVAAWESASDRFADRYDDYEELQIEATDYQGFDAAVWEYTYEGQRASNLGFVTASRGYALNFQTATERWDERQDIRRSFEAGFRLAGDR